MEIYSYHYGAAPGKGIGVQAQSHELQDLPLSSFLRELSSYHALESAERKGEKLFYLLEKDGYSILGLSYPESPKESGYNRTAPCGLQYILQTDVMKSLAYYYGEIVRTIDFRKPDFADPEPLNKFPVDRNRQSSTYMPDILAEVVDGLVRVALSDTNDILLVALPKGIESEYETARSVISQALDCIPAGLRKNIRFLTGLPVPEGETKCLTGFENVVRLNANVVFCPHQYLKELKAYRSFISVDMEQPDGEPGAFAKHILQFSNPETREQELQKISTRMLKAPGKQPYEELNQTAEDRAREKAAEEAEAQRRKAQAQAGGKKKSGKRQDPGSGVPDVRKDQRSSSRTDNPGEDAVKDNARKHMGNRHSGTGADSGRPASAGGFNSSAASEQQQFDNDSRHTSKKNKDHQDNQPASPLIKFITIFAVVATIAVVGLVLWFIFHADNNIILPEATSVPAFTEAPETKNQPTLSPGSEAASTPEPAAVPPAEEQNLNLPASPEPTAAPTAAAETEAEPIPQETVSVPTPEPTVQAYTEEPPLSDPDTISDSAFHNCYAITNGNDLKLRPDRSTAHDFLAKIAKGSHVWAVRTEKNNQGEDWTEAYYNGKHGYIMTKFLDFLSPEESRTYDQKQKTPVPANMYGQ